MVFKEQTHKKKEPTHASSVVQKDNKYLLMQIEQSWVLFVSFCLQSLATWESENKIHCKQTLVEADGPKTFWTRELNGDQLTLVSIKASE